MEIEKLIQDKAAWERLQKKSAEMAVTLDHKPFHAAKAALAELPDLPTTRRLWDQAAVTIGEDLAVDDPRRQKLEAALTAAMPWKKGPFHLYGVDLDAEWRSDYKWDRLAPHLPDQSGKRVLDVGANNAYYLFRLAAQNPDYMLAIDPVPRLWYQFQILQHYARLPNLEFAMWGWQELDAFDALFDTIFCMGILYHHRDPMGLLKNLLAALKPGGLLVMESIVIPGDESICLYPPDRYAMMRNVWFVPTVPAMKHMLQRAKFVDVEEIAVNVHRPDEQRTTRWNPGPSYEDFLDPNDPTRTIEGHPAPWRCILFARKKSR